MGIFKKINPSGKISWYADYYDSQGKRKRKAYPTKRLAEVAFSKENSRRFQEQVLGEATVREIKFSTLQDEFLRWSKTNSRHNTLLSHENSLIALSSIFKDYQVSKISVYDVERFKQNRLRQVSPASVNRELACLKLMFNKAEEWGFLQSSIAKRIKLLQEPPGRVEYLTQDEANKLLESCLEVNGGPPHLRPLVSLALGTGMRKGEIIALSWEDIDFENDLVHINRSKGRSGGMQARRDVFLPTPTKKDLELWWETSLAIKITRHIALVFGLKVKDFKRVYWSDINFDLNSLVLKMRWQGKKEIKFSNQDKKDLQAIRENHKIDLVFDVKDPKRAFGAALKRAGLPQKPFHLLRHTAASHAAMAGIDLTTLSQALGHSSITVTMKYIHLSPDHRKRVAEVLGHFWDTSGA